METTPVMMTQSAIKITTPMIAEEIFDRNDTFLCIALLLHRRSVALRLQTALFISRILSNITHDIILP